MMLASNRTDEPSVNVDTPPLGGTIIVNCYCQACMKQEGLLELLLWCTETSAEAAYTRVYSYRVRGHKLVH